MEFNTGSRTFGQDVCLRQDADKLPRLRPVACSSRGGLEFNTGSRTFREDVCLRQDAGKLRALLSVHSGNP